MQSPDSTHWEPFHSLVKDGTIPSPLTVSSSITAIAESISPGRKKRMNASTDRRSRRGRSDGQVKTYSPCMTSNAVWRSSMKLSPEVRTVSTPLSFRCLSVSEVFALTDTSTRSMPSHEARVSTTLSTVCLPPTTCMGFSIPHGPMRVPLPPALTRASTHITRLTTAIMTIITTALEISWVAPRMSPLTKPNTLLALRAMALPARTLARSPMRMHSTAIHT